MMRQTVLCAVVVVLVCAMTCQAGPNHTLHADDYKKQVDRIFGAAGNNTQALDRLAYVCDTFGPRFSGTEALEQAISWAATEMAQDGLNNVHTEPVMVPRWVRGEESLNMIEPRKQVMGMVGLVGSIATPAEGLTAEVIVVNSFADLEAKAKQNKTQGKIVVFNVPFVTYGTTVTYRSNGAVHAAKAGAIASLTRSVTPRSLYTPHTGGMSYEEGVKQIPAAAITVEDSMMLQRMQNRQQTVLLTLKMQAHFLPDSQSANVIAELTGSTHPDEIVVIGGHYDSHDIAMGAMDDGGGTLIAWESLILMKQLGIRPKRTIRAVLFTNEENGMRGATQYFDDHLHELNKTVFCMESDAGMFDVWGLTFAGTTEARSIMSDVVELLKPHVSIPVVPGGAGADVGPLTSAGVPGAGLSTVGNNHGVNEYFDYHHTRADTIDKIAPEAMQQCLGVMASVAYLMADVPFTLPRTK